MIKLKLGKTATKTITVKITIAPRGTFFHASPPAITAPIRPMYHKLGSTVNTPGQINAASAVYGIRFKNFSNFGEKFNLSIKIAGITLGMKVTSAQRIMSKVIFIIAPPHCCNYHQLPYMHPLKQYHHRLYTFRLERLKE